MPSPGKLRLLRLRPPPFFAGFAVCLAAALLFIPGVSAAPTTTDQASVAASNWLGLEEKPMGSILGRQVREVRTYLDDNGGPAYYVAFLEPAGLVFLPADDLVEPIIGFISDAAAFDPDDGSPLSDLVKRDIPGRIADARTAEVQAPRLGQPLADSFTEAQQKWYRLQSNGSLQAPGAGLGSISDVRVSPFIQSKWSQTTVGGLACYNYYTPPNASGTAANYPAGCVATAMSQVMRYWQYPTSPVVNTFTIKVNNNPQSAQIKGGDGAGGAYGYSSMVLDPETSGVNATQRQAIGRLLYDAGVSVNMEYTASSSGAWPYGSAFRNTFRYSNAIYGFNNGDNIDANTRNSMINPNLNARYPVIVAITGSSGGHAVVCDGYGYNSGTLYHHLNMGWAGTDDAWYNLPSVNASYTFTSVYGCTYNIFKSCTGEIISGRVTDSGGNPISGVTATASRGGTTYNAVSTTDSQGLYSIPCVPSNSTFTVSASKSGYTFASQTAATGRSNDTTDVNGITSPTTGNQDNVNFTSADAASVDVSGRWTGSWQSSSGTYGAVVFQLSQTGAAVTGTMQNSESSCSGDIPVTGTVQSSVLTISGACNGYSLNYTQGTLQSQTANGQYSVYNSSSLDHSGTFSIYKSSAFYGAFSSYGLYKYDANAWSLMSAASPKALAVWGPNLYGAFDTYGLYRNDGTWTLLSAASPDVITASGSMLYAGFKSYGLYKHDGYSWTLMASTAPKALTAWGSNLYAGFDYYGLYKHDGSSWTLMASATPKALAVSGANLYASFDYYGLYKHDGTSWSLLASAAPDALAVSGSTLYAAFTSYGLWKYDGAWTMLTGTKPDAIAVSGSTLYGAFGAYGLYKYDGGLWTQMSGAGPKAIAAQ